MVGYEEARRSNLQDSMFMAGGMPLTSHIWHVFKINQLINRSAAPQLNTVSKNLRHH
jgi:hypothetical protein